MEEDDDDDIPRITNYILHDEIWPLNRWLDGVLGDIISCRPQYGLILERWKALSKKPM